jgi:hypothetical protein
MLAISSVRPAAATAAGRPNMVRTRRAGRPKTGRRRRRRRADRQQLKLSASRPGQQMAVHGQEDQGGQQAEEVGQHRRSGPAFCGSKKTAKPGPSAGRSARRQHVDRGEDDAQREAHGTPIRICWRRSPALARKPGGTCGIGGRPAHGQGDGQPDRQADAHRHAGVVEHRRHWRRRPRMRASGNMNAAARRRSWSMVRRS